MQETISIKNSAGEQDFIIQETMNYEDTQRIIFINILWSTVMLLIGMLL